MINTITKERGYGLMVLYFQQKARLPLSDDERTQIEQTFVEANTNRINLSKFNLN